jgi:hypothetical protein
MIQAKRLRHFADNIAVAFPTDPERESARTAVDDKSCLKRYTYMRLLRMASLHVIAA